MNRSVRITVLLSLTLCMLGGEKAAAQFTDEAITRRWEKLPDGAQILRLWTEKDVAGKEPQIAILRLTDAQYKNFTSSPKNYLEGYDVFGKDRDGKKYRLDRIISRVDLSVSTRYATAKPKAGASDPWTIVVEHNYWCDSATIEFNSP